MPKEQNQDLRSEVTIRSILKSKVSSSLIPRNCSATILERQGEGTGQEIRCRQACRLNCALNNGNHFIPITHL